MVDTLISNTNDFIKTHVSDELHAQIVSELSTRKEKTKGSRKIKLTSEMLRQFLFYASMGLTLEKSANKCGLGEGTRKDYALKSTTFSEVSTLAKEDPDDLATMGLVEAMRGTKPYYFALKHPTSGDIKYIEISGKEPNVQIMQWWAEKKKLLGDGESAPGGVITMPIPVTPEQEAAVMRLSEFWYKLTHGKPTNTNTS